jgi:hypothetical protein
MRAAPGFWGAAFCDRSAHTASCGLRVALVTGEIRRILRAAVASDEK